MKVGLQSLEEEMPLLPPGMHSTISQMRDASDMMSGETVREAWSLDCVSGCVCVCVSARGLSSFFE